MSTPTLEQILAMTPGRDLSQLAVTLVLCWQHGQNGTSCERPFVSCPVCLADCSTNIAAASRLIDALTQRGLCVEMTSYKDENGESQNIVKVYRQDDYGNSWSVNPDSVHPSRSEAITKAAVLAALNTETKKQ